MERGFIFMLDAFISLIVVIAFVSTLNQFSRDYSYIQDETLYSYGRAIMNILLYHTVTVNDQEVSMVHALSDADVKATWNEKIDNLIPPQLGYSIDYYDGSSWRSFGLPYTREKDGAKRKVSVVSTIPVIIKNEDIEQPYKYDNYCHGPKTQPDSDVCMIPKDLYVPDEFATADAGYKTTFVRVVIEV